MLLKLLS